LPSALACSLSRGIKFKIPLNDIALHLTDTPCLLPSLLERAHENLT
jgi:hypothetical protein